MSVPEVMKNKNLKNFERHLKWEKQKMDQAVTQVLMKSAEPIAQMLVDVALTDRNPIVGEKILDRLFGRARQNIGLDGGAPDKPIVFMPASLMAKYEIKEGKYTEIDDDPDSPAYEENGPAAMLIEPLDEPIQ